MIEKLQTIDRVLVVAVNLSGISNQSVLGRMLRLPLKLIPSSMVVPILQGELRGKKWVSGSSDHGCWLGSYEYDKQKLFTQHISPGSVVFDIGAHVGFYTLLASTLAGRGGTVIAFEPMPGNLIYLRGHLLLNDVENANVIDAAVSDAEGRVWFKKDANSSMGAVVSTGDFEVRAVSLDMLISRGEIPIPSLIKMDIEGGEYRALLGARTLLTEHHPVILLATHGQDIHKSCCDYLRSLGYNLKPVVGKSVAETDEILASFDLPSARE